MKNNFRNKYLVISIRTLVGAMFIFSGIGGLMAGSDMSGVPADMIPFMQSLWDMGIFHMIKITEIVAGLMLITGTLPALAALFLVPICVGIIVVNSCIAPDSLLFGIVISLFVAYLGYAYWDKYKALFQR